MTARDRNHSSASEFSDGVQREPMTVGLTSRDDSELLRSMAARPEGQPGCRKLLLIMVDRWPLRKTGNRWRHFPLEPASAGAGKRHSLNGLGEPDAAGMRLPHRPIWSAAQHGLRSSARSGGLFS